MRIEFVSFVFHLYIGIGVIMYFHIDMNSYFASVEQQYDARLRGKPVGVCAYLSKNGCIIASSIEAKKWGVKTGMRVGEAKHLCPEIQLVENDPKKYRATTQKIFALLKEYTDDFELYSIDEAFLSIPYVHSAEEGFELGREWNTRIKNEVGEVLRSSIGFGTNYFYAKLFSDTGPKDSVTYVPPEQLDEYLASLTLEDVWGIGTRIARRLRVMGIVNPFQLKHADSDDLIAEFGKYGYDLWCNLNDVRPSVTPIDFPSLDEYPKSVGHSYCLPFKTYNVEMYKRILYKLCEKTCSRLRSLGKVAYGIAYSFRTQHSLQGDHGSFKVSRDIWDALDMYSRILPFFKQIPPVPIQFMAVSLFSLLPKGRVQLNLFENQITIAKKNSILTSFDKINQKWGAFTIMRGAMWQTDNFAHDRIGFRKL